MWIYGKKAEVSNQRQPQLECNKKDLLPAEGNLRSKWHPNFSVHMVHSSKKYII